jgi:hypothetical protein
LDGAVFCGLVGMATVTRLLMIQPNFHAVTAAALFAGFYFRNRAVAALVPLVAMTASDWVIGGYTREVMLAVYASITLPISWRAFLVRRPSAGRVATSAVASSLLFYLVTNAAVWNAGIWYPRGWDGLVECYAAALPFLWNALAGDLLFSGAFFGAYAICGAVSRAFAPSPARIRAPFGCHAAS